MLTQLFSIGLIWLLACMLPGADFAMVTKNTLIHSRRAGIFTSFGISCAILVHMTYCALGLAILISKSIILFSIIKYIGAAYLIYLGVSAILSKQSEQITVTHQAGKKSRLSDLAAFRQGFLCNLLNPKCSLFFLALFTVIIKPGTSGLSEVIYAIEMFIIILAWFSCLTLILTHPRVLRVLEKAEKYISKVLGAFLIGLGTVLAFAEK